jgi:PKD domain/RTX calcium-binding nonapeptide repeat (4 copies)
VAADHATVTATEGTTASNTGTFSDYDDAVTISSNLGTVSQSGSQSGTWSWSQLGLNLGTYSVTIKATNANGTTSSVSFSVTINDAPLTGSGTTLSTINEGSSTGLVEVATFTDANPFSTSGDFTASIDWGDGHSSAATSISFDSTRNLYSVKASHTYQDNGTYTIVVTISDAGGASTAPHSSIQVNNVAPTATINGAPSSSPEGTTINLTSTVADPSSIDTAAGFSYAWAVTKNGSPYGSGSAANFSFTPNHSGTYVVTLIVTDKDGGSSPTVSKTITITNVSPSPTITGPASGVPYELLSYTGNFTDPGSGGETYTFAWKATGPGGFILTGTGQNFSFTPTVIGTNLYKVSFTVTDDSGGSGSVSKSPTVVTTNLETDPLDPSKTALVIGGTASADTIVVQPVSMDGKYSVTVNGSTPSATYRPTGHIIIYGGDGNDNLQLASNSSFGMVTIPGLLFGGAGNDTLDVRGSSANNVLVGGDGNDTLLDGTGYNILIGGAGADNLNQTSGMSYVGNLGNDILLGGATIYDANINALLALMQEWGNTSHSLSQKINFLSGHPGGLNGSFFLNSSTIISDGSNDQIFFNPTHQNWLP